MRSMTVALLKPDAVEDRRIGTILTEIETKLVVADFVLARWAPAAASAFYRDHRGKPYFEELVAFMTSGQLGFATLVSLDEEQDAVKTWRAMMGATDPAKAAPDTIRGKYARKGRPIMENLVHGSDSAAAVQHELTTLRAIVPLMGEQAMRLLAYR